MNSAAARLVMAAIVLAGWWCSAGWSAAQDAAPFGIARRVPWTAGRITGSPDPPPPYRTARAFANLTFNNPLDIAWFPDGQRIAVLEQHGKIYSFPADEHVRQPDLMLDLNTVLGLERIKECRGTGDAYGIAFHPRFAQNHYLYVCYTLDYTTRLRNHPNGSRVSRFTVRPTNPPTIDPSSEQIVFEWLQGGHNGGCIKFGPADGYLYLSTGDAGDPDPPDPFNSGQDIGDFLSSILRIDVDHPGAHGEAYAIPPDNPFIHAPGARPEVWCYGLRNPWRMNFDRQTHQLWVGDVGWELWESVYCAKAGGNYGWSIMEGPNPVHPDARRGPTPITPPAVTLPHTEAASITGGTVYHGSKLPGLVGSYVFGDWQTRTLWAARCKGDALEPYHVIAQTDQKIVAFGEGPDGELLIVDHGGGGLWHIAPNDAAYHPEAFPRKLSQTGLFTSLPEQAPSPGVIPFAINAPQWVDGAAGEHWVAIPGTQVMSWGKGVWGDDKPAWPKDSVLVRTLSLGDGQDARHVETQILHFDGMQWQAYTYAWNEQQTDADLVDAAGDERAVSIPDRSAPGGTRKRPWHFDARAQCLTCHNVWVDYALAFQPPQLDRVQRFGEVSDNQVRTFRHLGLLLEPLPARDDRGPNDPPPPPPERATLTNPYDASADLNERARSYLDVNCSACHRFGGGGSALFDVRKEMHAGEMKLLNARPNLGGFGLDDAYLAAAGHPERSVVLYRMAKLGRDRMPRVGSEVVDARGVALMAEWVRSMSDHGGAEPATSPVAGALAALRDPAVPAEKANAAIDQLLASTSGGLALACAMHEDRLPAATRERAAAAGLRAGQDGVRDLFRPFDPNGPSANRLGQTFNVARLLAMPGDARRGRDVFFKLGAAPAAAGAAPSAPGSATNAGGLCARCHVINGQGADFGPDLSHIASKYNKADLLDNVIYPSKTIAPGYATYVVRTKSGDTFSGFLVKRTEDQVVLKDAQLQVIRIRAADVDRIKPQPVSAMPEGLLADLEPQQAADLLAYLASLK